MKKTTTFLLLLTCSFYLTTLLQAAPVEPVRTMQVPFASAPPTLDGVADDCYGNPQTTTIFNATGYDGPADFEAWFQLCWDQEYLYIYAVFTDDYNHSYEVTVGNSWEFDNAVVYLQLDTNTVEPFYDENTHHVRINRGLDAIEEVWSGGADPSDFGYYMESETAGGWLFEIAIPWTCALAEGSNPDDIMNFVSSPIGFDFEADDSDNASGDIEVGNRDVQAAWDSDDPDTPDDRTEDLAWNTTSVFGYITLMEGAINPSPVADAGPDQTVAENTLVTLDGTDSYDPDEESITYTWSAPSGIVLSDVHSATPSFTTPVYSQNTTLSLSLVVNDGYTNSAPDQVQVFVTHENLIPIADAGPDQTVNERGLVLLDGSNSYDPDFNSFSYNWTSSHDVDLINSSSANPMLVAPNVLDNETVQFYLEVDDGSDISEPDTMNLFVQSMGDDYDTLVVYDTVYVVDVVTNNNTIIISVVDNDGDLIAREVEGVLYIELYPNPADQFIRLRSDEMILEIKIYDMAGSLLTEEVINDVEAELNLGDFTAGNYILKMITDTGEVSKQFVLE